MTPKEILLGAITAPLVSLGYKIFETPDASHMEINAMPAALITSLRITGSSGRRECLTKYKVGLILMDTPSHTDSRAQTLNALEDHARQFRTELCLDSALSGVEGFSAVPVDSPLTKHAECSLKIEFQAVVYSVAQP